MNKDFENLFEDVKKNSLTESERVSMRNILLAFMSEHPAKAPFMVRTVDMLAALGDSFGSQQYARLRLFPATLALFLVVSVGTAYAAEGALPGDSLYAVKINLNESLKGAMALSKTAEASWETERIERRLVEAEALVADGRLTPTAQATLEAEILNSAQRFEQKVALLADAKGEAAVAAAQSDLEASLIGHAEVLVALTADSGDGDDVEAAPIIRAVLSKAEAAQAARAAHEASILAKRDGKEVRTAAIQKKNEAKQAVRAVKAKATSVLVATTSAGEVAQESAASAEVAINEAEVELRRGDYGSAFTTFQEAIRTAKTVEVHLDASERLNTDVKIFTRTRSDTDASLMMAAPTEN